MREMIDILSPSCSSQVTKFLSLRCSISLCLSNNWSQHPGNKPILFCCWFFYFFYTVYVYMYVLNKKNDLSLCLQYFLCILCCMCTLTAKDVTCESVHVSD